MRRGRRFLVLVAPGLVDIFFPLSYRPPDEYLLSPEEEEAWKEQDEDERETDFLPKKHDALRQVATYPEALRERFYRCLDLYMAPRQIKMRMNVNPEKLLPKLPSAKGEKIPPFCFQLFGCLLTFLFF